MAINIVAPKPPSEPELPPGLASDFSLVKASFPKIADKISVAWGTIGLQDYLAKTIFDVRGGRQGFPVPVVSALMRLNAYHDARLPKTDAGTGHVWEDAK
jgi:hypothetical protein